MLKLSIVMPVFNKSHLTQEAILNIFRVCEGIDYELLVINDGSTDDTEDIISSLYQFSNGRLQYYRFEENVGVTKAWNQGVKYAEGEYVCVINNDVIYPEGFFQLLMDGFSDGIAVTNPRFTEGDEKQPSPIMYFKNMICGHTFMIDGKYKELLFPIDERLIIFGNDNWLHFMIRDLGLKQKVIRDAICHHLKSQTTFFVPNNDMDMYYRICDEKGRKTEQVYPLPIEDPLSDFTFS